MTAEPGRITSGVIMDGTPAAPTTMSADLVTDAQSGTPVWTTVTRGVGAGLL